MKNSTLLYILILCCLHTTFAQVYPGNLTIDEQSDIDLFDYTSVDGDLVIQEKSPGAIVDLNELLMLTSIKGNLKVISNETLSNLDGLSNLSNIGFGSITISNNTVLNNIDGLSKITEITERLVIENNAMLDNLNGLSNVTRLDGFEGFSLQVKRNPKLSNACGIIPIIAYDPSYVQVYPSINSNSANTSSVQDIIANCNTCKIYEGNLILTSQAQVDTFDYCEITGNLTIQEDVAGDITDLSSLATLETLGGGLYIKSNTSITNLDAFHNLKTINGSLELSKNAILANIDGLSGLEIINGNLVISINKKITSLRAFNTLTTLNGNLNLLANEGLTDLDGFVNLKQIGGFLEIKGHRSMVSFTGLSNLTTIGTDIRIIGNDLSNLDGLAKLNEIKGNLELTNNFKLSDIHVFANILSIKELRIKNNNLSNFSGFSGLKEAGAIILNNCDIINLNDLSNLTSLANRLVLYNNKNLENISGISNAIGKNIIQLEIGGNPNLRSLSGLENLERIDGLISIFNNSQLADVDGLQNTKTVTKTLKITNNRSLENACGVVHLLKTVNAVGGGITIENNAAQTSTVNSILVACYKTFVGDIMLTSQAEVDDFDYEIVKGRITIAESIAGNITNLDALKTLKKVGSIHIINNIGLQSFSGIGELQKFTNPGKEVFVLDSNTSISVEDTYFIAHYFLCRGILRPLIGFSKSSGNRSEAQAKSNSESEVLRFPQVKVRFNVSDQFMIIREVPSGFICKEGPRNPFSNEEGEEGGDSKFIDVIGKNTDNEIILYPTIIEGNSITLSGVKNNFKYTIYSATAVLVDSENVKSDTEEKTIVFNKQLTTGMYFLRIEQEGGKNNTLRFIVK
ncbi:hypothetical protein [Aquimarina algiphila]|uniref:hypothetical protein n=1 Tax=Aquimarina algiphila TaxID=2047982 RepID=UPI0024934EC3|nr:hypothetical protein [Aquimarina algiphila]